MVETAILTTMWWPLAFTDHDIGIGIAPLDGN